ncbi:MAG TPA: RNA polymerase sigma factor [Patescibacteria group bacterium]|nr:RNA polymerase sigma factor [Patescibacteria group bacterium]
MQTRIEAILRGDEQAVAQFYYEFAPRLRRFVARKIPTSDVEDIVNETFVQAIDSLSRLTKEANLSAFLYKIAQNRIVDFYRKRKIKSVALSQIPFLEIISSEFDQPEFQMEKDRIRSHLEHAFHNISEKYRYIIMLHYEEHLSIKQIALQLDMTPKAAESLLFRARQSFIKAYGRD